MCRGTFFVRIEEKFRNSKRPCNISSPVLRRELRGQAFCTLGSHCILVVLFPIWRRKCGEFVSVGEYLYELPTNHRLFHFHFFNEICVKFPQKVKIWLLVGTDQFVF